MVDAGPSAGDGRRRGKKNRGRQGNNKKKRSKGRGGNRNTQQGSYLPEPQRDDNSILGGRTLPQQPPKRVEQEAGPPDAFALFCAYHLGISAEDGYQKPHTDEIARRFGISIDELKKLLVEFKLDEKSIRALDYDLEGAKIDIRVAPPGISPTETAREHFEELLAAQDAVQSE